MQMLHLIVAASRSVLGSYHDLCFEPGYFDAKREIAYNQHKNI